MKSCRSVDALSIRATNTMVSDLPDPCVCHTTPDRDSGVFPDLDSLNDLACRAVLLVAANDLDSSSRVHVLEDRTCAKHVQKRCRGKQPLDEHLLGMERLASGQTSFQEEKCSCLPVMVPNSALSPHVRTRRRFV